MTVKTHASNLQFFVKISAFLHAVAFDYKNIAFEYKIIPWNSVTLSNWDWYIYWDAIKLKHEHDK